MRPRRHPRRVTDAVSKRAAVRGLSAAALVATFLAPRAAEAQTIPSPYLYLERAQEAGPFGGYMVAGTGRFGYGPEGGPAFGVRYGVELAGPVSVEGVVGLVDATRDVIDPGRVEGDRIIGQADMLLTTIDARLKFSFTGRRAWHRLSPFMTFGGGVVFDGGSRSELDDILLPEDVFDLGTSFFGTVGLGSRFFLTDRFALRADGVFSLWQLDTPPGFSDPERAFVAVEDNQWEWGTSFSVALLYRW